MRKNIIKAFVLAAVIASSTVVNAPILNTVQEVQAASIGTVSNLNIKRTDKTDLTLTWDSVNYADGYEIYMKTGKGDFKQYKTVKTNAINISKLKENTQYIFKIRAYKKNGKKKSYGSFSQKGSIKLSKSIYLTDIFAPTGNHTNVDLFENNAFTLCGSAYAKGFHTYVTNSGGIAYNINGDFDKLEFVWGTYETHHIGNLNVYGDDELLYNGTSNDGQTPETIKLDVTGVTKLTFSFARTSNCGSLDGYTGVGNIKLTYN